MSRMPDLPCPWCAASIETPNLGGMSVTRSWSSDTGEVTQRSRSTMERTCPECDRPVRRDNIEGAPWRRVFVVGDRVAAPHRMDALSGNRYPAMVTDTGSRPGPTGDVDTVTVLFDQTEVFGKGESLALDADGVEPLPSS